MKQKINEKPVKQGVITFSKKGDFGEKTPLKMDGFSILKRIIFNKNDSVFCALKTFSKNAFVKFPVKRYAFIAAQKKTINANHKEEE